MDSTLNYCSLRIRTPWFPLIHTEPLDKRLDHRNDALDVPEVRVEVIQDGAVSCIR